VGLCRTVWGIKALVKVHVYLNDKQKLSNYATSNLIHSVIHNSEIMTGSSLTLLIVYLVQYLRIYISLMLDPAH
jgi:hypothetical protein